MRLECCVCGGEAWSKLQEAVKYALESRDEVMPVIGVVCDNCLSDLREKGIIK